MSVATGAVTTVAGNGTAGFSGEGGPATVAGLHTPYDVKLDAAGNVYFSDGGSGGIRVVNTQSAAIVVFGVTIEPGTIRTVAGANGLGYSGDNGPAASARLGSRWRGSPRRRGPSSCRERRLDGLFSMQFAFGRVG